jgi:hypothetical protein
MFLDGSLLPSALVCVEDLTEDLDYYRLQLL